MEKPKLSSAGVSEKLIGLYAMSEEGLGAEIDDINIDLKSWLIDSFETTPEQDQFINSWSTGYTIVLAEQLTRTLEQRWPVLFLTETPELTTRSSKWIKSKEENEATESGANKTVHVTGSLTITTGY